jgi:hypothetical protein
LHAVTFIGLASWIFLHLALLQEGVHAHGHTGHGLSLLARAFADGTLLPPALALLTALTLVLIVATESPLGPSEEGETAQKVLPPFVSGVFLLMALAGIVLWFTDYQHLPTDAGPYSTLVSTSTTVLLALSVLAAVYWLLRAPVAAWAMFVVPLLGIVPFLLLPTATYIGLSSAYPRVGWVSVAALIVVVPALALARQAARRAGRDGLEPFVLFAASTWTGSLFSLTAMGAAYPYHHLCLDLSHAGFHRRVLFCVVGFYVIVWILIVMVQWRRHGRSHSSDAPPASLSQKE